MALILAATGAFAKVTALSVLAIQAIWVACCLLSPLFTASVIKLVRKGLGLVTGIKKKKAEAPAEEEAPEEAPEEEPAPIFEEETAAPEETEEAAPEAEAPAQEEAPLIPPTLDPDVIEASEPKPDPDDLTDDVLESLQTFAPREAPAQKAPEEAPPRIIVSEEMRSSFSSVDGYVEDLAAKNAPEAPEAQADFSLYGSEGGGRRIDAADIEKAYERAKQEESDVRRAFTAPEAPKAPVFDTPAPETPDEDQAPLDTSDVSVFNDDLFRRFENDDDVFAGLREEESEKHYDF